MRYVLSPDASRDLKEIRRYLNGVPAQHAERIAHSLQQFLRETAEHPAYGSLDPWASELAGEDVRRRVHSPYVLFYRIHNSRLEVIALLHGARDLQAILTQRLQ